MWKSLLTPAHNATTRSVNASVSGPPPTFADSPLRNRPKRAAATTLAPLKIHGTPAAKGLDTSAVATTATKPSTAASADTSSVAVPFTGADGSIAYSDGA